MAAQRRPSQAPGRGALQSTTGGGYRAPARQPRPAPVPTQAAPSPMAPAAPAGLPKRYAGMDPAMAAERFKQFKAGQLPGQRAALAPGAIATGVGAPPNMLGGGRMRAEDAAAFREANPDPFGDAAGRMQDLVRSFPPGQGGGMGAQAGGGRFNMAGGDLYRAYPSPPGQGGGMEFQTGGGLQAPSGASSPANQPPGIEGAIANLRNQLGESQAGGASPSGADPMSMIARLRGNAQIAQANGYPIGGAGGGKGPAPMPGQGGVMNIPPMNASGMLAPGTKPFFGDISQMPGASSGPIGLSGLPVAGGAGPGGNPYLSLLRNRLGA